MILIAGGTGHLGSELVPLLRASGVAVRVLTRDPVRRAPVVEGVEICKGDVRDRRSVEAAMAGVTVVVSAISGFGPSGGGPRAIDYQGNANLIRAAEAAAVRKFVLVSMHGATADHPMELLRMKHLAEQVLRASRLAWTVIRPTIFMELWAGILGGPILKSGKAMVFGHGDNPINFVSACDVARFIELALVDPGLQGQSLDVGGPENLTLNQLVHTLERAFNKKAAARHVPLRVMQLSSLLMRPLKPGIARMIQAGAVMDTMDMRFDASELRQRYPGIALTRFEHVAHERLRAAMTAIPA